MSEREVRARVEVPDFIRKQFSSLLTAAVRKAADRGVRVDFVADGQEVVITGRHVQAGDVPRLAREALAALPPAHAVVFANSRRGVGVAYAARNGHAFADPMTRQGIVDNLADFLAVSAKASTPEDRSSEELIRRLSILLDEKDALIAALTQAYDNDRRTAEARIAYLEAQLAALQAERLHTDPRWRDPIVLATLAVGVLTVVAPVAAAFTEHRLAEPVAKVVEQAQKVQAECNVTVTVGPSPG